MITCDCCKRQVRQLSTRFESLDIGDICNDCSSTLEKMWAYEANELWKATRERVLERARKELIK